MMYSKGVIPSRYAICISRCEFRVSPHAAALDQILHDRTTPRSLLQSREYSECAFLLADLELVKLPEDITLAGFTPLMLNPQDPCYMKKTEDMVSYVALRHVGSSVTCVHLRAFERSIVFFFVLSFFRRHLVETLSKMKFRLART